ncbi:hypothetical protein Tco_0484313 [Tanacetum coccineum]
MEARCIALELKYQNQALKSGQHGQILNETSNKAKMKKEIEAFETINIKLEHNTKFDKTSVLGKPVLPSLRNQSVVRQPNAFKSERAQMLKQRNSTTSLTTYARIQTTADDSKPKPRSNNQTSRSLPVSKSTHVTIMAVPKADHSKSSSSFSDSKIFVCSTCHKYVFNANHDACITKLLKEIFTGHRFSPNKTSTVYEKTSPISDLRWKPTGRIFKSIGLRWIPIGKLFDSCTSKVDSEPPHGSNVDIPNIHECKQTLDVSACTSINVQKEQSLDLSAGTLCNVNKENLRVWLLKKLISQKPLSKWIHR